MVTTIFRSRSISALAVLICINAIQGFSFTHMSRSSNQEKSPFVDRRAAMQSTVASAFLLFIPVAARASYIDPVTDAPEVTKRVYLDVSIGGKEEGRIVIGLYGKLLPRTVDNFATLFESDAYAGTNFYRVISDVSIQGGNIGDPSGKTGRSALEDGKPFEPDNYNLKHTKAGLISAVRGLDGRIDSRFFFNCQDDAGWADDRYAAFGIIEEGLEMVKRIEKLPVRPPKNSPTTEVKILHSGSVGISS
jgi:peptidyl-prolyl cis-trans isomerase B (cyclophilin B)